MMSNVRDLQRVRWEVAVFDEAHTMKNTKSKTRKAALELLDGQPQTRRYGLTGTPMSNDHLELWTLFDFVSGSKIGAAKDFKEFYQTAIQMGQRRTASQNEVRKRLEPSLLCSLLLCSCSSVLLRCVASPRLTPSLSTRCASGWSAWAT